MYNVYIVYIIYMMLRMCLRRMAFCTQKDYYRVLGLSPSASAQQIKARFHELAKKHHPDSQASSRDEVMCHSLHVLEELFKEIVQAYNTLSNEQEKKKYDQKVA